MKKQDRHYKYCLQTKGCKTTDTDEWKTHSGSRYIEPQAQTRRNVHWPVDVKHATLFTQGSAEKDGKEEEIRRKRVRCQFRVRFVKFSLSVAN
jgi:hypothetical protein